MSTGYTGQEQKEPLPVLPPGYGYGARYNDQGGHSSGPTQFGPTQGQGYSQPYTAVEPKPEDFDEGFANTRSFSEKAIRMNFIQKVYMILVSQLIVTFGIVAVFTFVGPVKNFVQKHFYIYIIAYVLFIVLYIALVCFREVRRNYPTNFICLGIFTLVFSYMAGAIASYHDTDAVLICMGITLLVTISVSVFACQTKFDFTMCSGLLFCLVLVLFFFGWACVIINFTMGTAKILQAVYGGLGALVFCLFLAYDTQQVIGGKKYEINPEEYIYGAMQLYVDVVYIFLFILMIFGGGRSD